MTDHTVLHYGVMLKHKRTLIAGMTLEAKVVYTLIGLQHGLPEVIASMWIMTIRTAHLALFDGVMRGKIGLGHHILMTGATELVLPFGKQGFSVIFMYSVTSSACDLIFCMGGTSPIQMFLGAVTGGAHCGHLFLIQTLFAEAQYLGLVSSAIHMQRTRPMATLTTNGLGARGLK